MGYYYITEVINVDKITLKGLLSVFPYDGNPNNFRQTDCIPSTSEYYRITIVPWRFYLFILNRTRNSSVPAD